MRSTDPLPMEPVRHDGLHAELDAWRTNVGDPITYDAPATAAAELTGIDILCWNVAIGLGQLERVLELLLSGAFEVTGGPHGRVARTADRPLVLLLQEVYRRDASVPAALQSQHHGGLTPSDERADIVELARRLELSLRYSPSMRNGDHASDRGNAVLSNVRLAGAHAFLLPYVRQRRVAVAACIAGHPRLRFVSAHLDTHGRVPGSTLFTRPGSGRAAQGRALARSLAAGDVDTIVGADLNSVFGMSDPAVRALVAAGMHPARRIGRWRHTFHHPLRLLVDHVLFLAPTGRIASVDVIRLDERPRDRSRRVFGSDHHPLLAHVQLASDA